MNVTYGASFVSAMPPLDPKPYIDLDRQLKWDRRFLEFTNVVRSWSKDPSSKVGAVIVSDDHIIVGVGYNGFPRGCDDSPEIYADRERKLSRVVHAEMNAILNANSSTKSTTIYLSGFNGPPCDRCSAHIIQAGIKRVVYLDTGEELPERWKTQIEASFVMLEEAGVKCEGVKM